jgi:hypothetical protein
LIWKSKTWENGGKCKFPDENDQTIGANLVFNFKFKKIIQVQMICLSHVQRQKKPIARYVLT